MKYADAVSFVNYQHAHHGFPAGHGDVCTNTYNYHSSKKTAAYPCETTMQKKPPP